jgi:DNA-directed RNA polymerase specialized sigma24 family protein
MGIMQRLPESDRNLLMSYWFGRLTVGALAAREGVALITVRRRLSRARGRFAKLARRDAALAQCLESSPRWAASRGGESL